MRFAISASESEPEPERIALAIAVDFAKCEPFGVAVDFAQREPKPEPQREPIDLAQREPVRVAVAVSVDLAQREAFGEPVLHADVGAFCFSQRVAVSDAEWKSERWPECEPDTAPVDLAKRHAVRKPERVSLFDDELTHALLDAVDTTADFPTPLFPNCACGSHRTDDQGHLG